MEISMTIFFKTNTELVLNLTYLEQHWYHLLSTLSVSQPIATKWWECCVTQYTQKQRFYHNLSHLQHLHQLWEVYHNSLEHPTEIALSIWFHDWVYEPTQLDNELKSAQVYLEFMEETNLALPIVYELILATQTHTLTLPADKVAYTSSLAYFLDFDLSILGSSSENYQKYAQEIRNEYIHVSESDYNKGRKNILERFLQKNTLYYTETFRQLYEVSARHNLQQEINVLSQI